MFLALVLSHSDLMQRPPRAHTSGCNPCAADVACLFWQLRSNWSLRRHQTWIPPTSLSLGFPHLTVSASIHSRASFLSPAAPSGPVPTVCTHAKSAHFSPPPRRLLQSTPPASLSCSPDPCFHAWPFRALSAHGSRGDLHTVVRSFCSPDLPLPGSVPASMADQTLNSQ